MPCSVCARVTEVAAIDSLLDNGSSLSDVAKQFPGTSRFALARHLKHRKADAESPISETMAQCRLWMSRADDQYASAVADDDTRSAISAIASGLRAVETALRTAEKEKEVAEEAEADDAPISIGSLDDVMEMFNRVPDNAVDAGKLAEALRRAKALNQVDAMQMFYKMIECPEFASDIVVYATSWEPKEKGKADEPFLEKASAPN
jgi:hypothetical protein